MKNIVNMAFTEAQKAYIVAKYIETESVTVTQIQFHKKTHKALPYRNTIRGWQTRFLKGRNVEHIGGNGRPRVSYTNVKYMRSLFERNPRQSMRQAESLLNMSRSTVQQILCNCLELHPQKM